MRNCRNGVAQPTRNLLNLLKSYYLNKVLFILFLIVINIGYGQTYIDVTNQFIQNPSFEDYTACPQSNSAYPNSMWIDSVLGWYAPTLGTSDYFNVCNTNNLNSVPNNTAAGYQYAYHGSAYCGFLAYSLWSNHMWSEYIQTQLLQPLEVSKYYKFTMRINRANDYNLAVKNIGVNFSEFSDTDHTSAKSLNILPTIFNGAGYITDTLNWIVVQGVFQASGDENYLTIGWFGDTITDDYTFFIPPDIDPITGDSLYLTDTYYLVDSLKLYEIEYDYEDFNINVITPNGDNINDVFELPFSYSKVSLLNRWGNLIWENTGMQFWNGKSQDGNDVSDGVYFYVIETENKTYKGFVQVVR
jgi:gliding motility-associated-like protein